LGVELAASLSELMLIEALYLSKRVGYIISICRNESACWWLWPSELRLCLDGARTACSSAF